MSERVPEAVPASWLGLLKTGFEHSSHWAHVSAGLFAIASDVVKPALPHCTMAVGLAALALAACLVLAMRFGKIASEIGATVVVYFLIVLAVSVALLGLQAAIGEDEHGAVAKLVPGVERLQERLGLLEGTLRAVQQDTAALLQNQKEEAERAAEREAVRRENEQRLERLVVDAAGGGAPAARAIVGIRDLLRPGNPEIDGVPAEGLPALVRQIIEDLRKPATQGEDFDGAVRAALSAAQARASKDALADAARALDAALARSDADDRDRARRRAAVLAQRESIEGVWRGRRDDPQAMAASRSLAEALARFDAEDRERVRARAALLAERGRLSKLLGRHQEAAAFYARAAEISPPWTAWDYVMQGADALREQGEDPAESAALVEAIARYRSALALAPRERSPSAWGATQSALGNALEALGRREGGTTRLEEAVAADRAALQVLTVEQAPTGWTKAQQNLGSALHALGERESGTARLEEAVAAWEACLTVAAAAWPPPRVQALRASIEAAKSAIGLRAATAGQRR